MIPWWHLEFATLVLERGKVGSVTIRELVSASGLSRQTVQGYVRDFEQVGLVVRSRVVEGGIITLRCFMIGGREGLNPVNLATGGVSRF